MYIYIHTKLFIYIYIHTYPHCMHDHLGMYVSMVGMSWIYSQCSTRKNPIPLKPPPQVSSDKPSKSRESTEAEAALKLSGGDLGC